MVKAIVALLVGLALCACAPLLGEAEVFDIEQEGAKASQLHTVALSEHNAAVINDVLQRMRPLDTLLVPNKTFWTMGGISASGARHNPGLGSLAWCCQFLVCWGESEPRVRLHQVVAARRDGRGEGLHPAERRAQPHAHLLGHGYDGRTPLRKHAIRQSVNPSALAGRWTATASGGGVGSSIWRCRRTARACWSCATQASCWSSTGCSRSITAPPPPGRNACTRAGGRLSALVIRVQDSPYWSFWANDVDTLEVRHAAVDVRRNAARQHDLYNLQAFNTDGFDVAGRAPTTTAERSRGEQTGRARLTRKACCAAGRHVWIHDCSVWNDDDSVCVKELGREGQQAQCSEHILVERVAASGLGLSVGSVGASADHHCVRNVTFRDCTMRDTYKVRSGMARRGQRRRCGGGAGGALQQTCGEVSVAAAQGIYVKSRPDAQAAEGSYRPPSARDQELLELLQRSYREDEELEGTLLAAHGGVRGGDDDSESLEAFLERVQSVFDGMGLELTPLDEGALLALDAEAQEQQQEMGAGGASETATGMSAEISDVMYENIVIHKPTQWSIWVGPQQAVYAGACSLLWPWVPGAPRPPHSLTAWVQCDSY
eukprot:scaffold2017_cov387-Prasinococcus_capsulatus_cf.AAC.2